MVGYQLFPASAPFNGILRNDGLNIPNDPLNVDWQAYQAWLALGNNPMLATPTKADLAGYAESVWQACLAAGQTFNVAAPGATALPILCDGTNDTRADLALLALFGQQNPNGTKTWLDNKGVATVLTGTQLVTLATLAGNWVSNSYPAFIALLADIQGASPSVTTRAQIDAYAWPSS